MSTSPVGSRASIDILEELQLIAAQNLEKLDINKYYEVIRELGKGTYGKVDLVVHKIRGKHWNIFSVMVLFSCEIVLYFSKHIPLGPMGYYDYSPWSHSTQGPLHNSLT